MGQMFDIVKLRKAIRKKQATINRNSKKLKSAPKTVVVGWDKSSGSYPEQDGKPVSYIALIHEEGLGHHSEKGMVKNTTHIHGQEWIALYKELVKKGFKNGKSPNYFVIQEKVGRQMRDDLRRFTYEIGLVDTQRLANSIIVRYKRR
jgi:hypothetical protein